MTPDKDSTLDPGWTSLPVEELDALRAEKDELDRAWRDKMDEVRAENAKMKAQMLRLAALETVVEENDALRAENEQLKEANAMLGEERDAWRQAFHRAHQVRGESLMACPLCQH